LIKLDDSDADAANWRGWLFGLDLGGVVIVATPGWQCIGSAAGVDYADGQWHLITATYDSGDGTVRLYTDGDYTWQMTVDLSANPALPAPLCIGGRDGHGSVDGAVDDVRVYSYPLDAKDVAGLYTDWNPGVSHLYCRGRCRFR